MNSHADVGSAQKGGMAEMGAPCRWARRGPAHHKAWQVAEAQVPTLN